MTVSPFLLCAILCVFGFISCSVAPQENISLSLLPEEVLQLILKNSVPSFHRLVQVNKQWARVVKEVVPYAEREDLASISQKATEKFESFLQDAIPTIISLNRDSVIIECEKAELIAKALSIKIFKIYKSLSTVGYSPDCIQMFAEDLLKCYVDVYRENRDSYLIRKSIPEDLLLDFFRNRLEIKLTNHLSKGHDRVSVKKWADRLIEIILMLKAHGAPDEFLAVSGDAVYFILLDTLTIRKTGVHFLAWCLSQCQLNIDGRPAALQTDSSGSSLPDLKNELSKLYKNIGDFVGMESLSPHMDTLHKFADMKSKNQSKVWTISDLRELIETCLEKTLAIELFLRHVIQQSQNELLAQVWKELDFHGIHFIIEYMIDLYGNQRQKALLNELIAANELPLLEYHAGADILFTKQAILRNFASLNKNNVITYREIDGILDRCTDEEMAMEVIVREVIGNSQNNLLRDMWTNSKHSKLFQVINSMVALHGSSQQKSMITDLNAEYGKVFDLDCQDKSEDSFDFADYDDDSDEAFHDTEEVFDDDLKDYDDSEELFTDARETPFDDDREEAFNGDLQSNQGMCSIS